MPRLNPSHALLRPVSSFFLLLSTVLTVAMLAHVRKASAAATTRQSGFLFASPPPLSSAATSSSRRRSWATTPYPTQTRLYAVTIPKPSTYQKKDTTPSIPPPPSSDSSPSATVPAVPAYNHRDTLMSRDGLPLVYEPKTIKKYWDARPAEMQRRWALFLSVTAPFVTKLVKGFTQGTLFNKEAELARDLRVVLEKLGPTFVKLGQALSIRPDIIGPAATDELQKLQDAVPPFSNDIAFKILEEELGCPWQDVFSELSTEPIAAASLAQVYKAKLKENGEWVAVKVQRPDMLATVSKDLYVMRRAVEVYQTYIVERFTAQKTDYKELLQVFATGFYEELDFLNEATSQMKMKELLESSSPGVYIPKVYSQLSTRRLLVSEWIDGIKLTQASQQDIRRLTKLAQECFLRQLLELGTFHADPHPGNLLLMDDKSKGELAILDWGLVSELQPGDMEVMVSALIHTANKDFARLIDDLVDLKVLPANIDRAQVLPVMQRVIGPYVFQGGGAKNLNFQSLSRDLTKATLEIPFSIPSYFALIARALGILEGIALTGDSDYRIVMESYPFVSRRLLTNEGSPRLQQALNDILYGSSQAGGERLSFRRLSSLLAYAMNVQQGLGGGEGGSAAAAAASSASLFVDFDNAPASTALRLNDTLSFLLADNASPLRALLVSEITNTGDLLLRQQFRRTVSLLPRPPPLPFLPPFLPPSLVDELAPPLSLEEEVFLGSLAELGATVVGEEGMKVLEGGGGGLGGLAALPRPDRVVAWLTSVNTEDVMDVARLLEPGTPSSRNIVAFGSEILRGLLNDRAVPRLSRAFGGIGGGGGRGGGSEKAVKKEA